MVSASDAIRDFNFAKTIPPEALEVLRPMMKSNMEVHNAGIVREILRSRLHKTPNFMLDLVFRGYYDQTSMPFWLRESSREVIRAKHKVHRKGATTRGMDMDIHTGMHSSNTSMVHRTTSGGLNIVQADVHELEGQKYDLASVSNIYDWSEDVATPLQTLCDNLLANGGALIARRARGGLQEVPAKLTRGIKLAPFNNEVQQRECSFLFGGANASLVVHKRE